MVKNQLLHSSFRQIKSSLTRFISLLMMSLLGVFVFVGLKATAPFMLNSLDHYLDSNNIYDLKLTSTLGFTEEELALVKGLNGVMDAEITNSTDLMMRGQNEKEYTIRIHSNQQIINNCGLDIKDNEIYVEENVLTKAGYKIGDVLKLSSSELNYEEFIIKGTVDSALYFNNAKINNSRGKTNIASGTLNFYAFVAPEAFNLSYSKYLYITVYDALKEETNSAKYLALIDNVYKAIDKDMLLEGRVKSINDTIATLNQNITSYLTKRDELNLILENYGYEKEEFYQFYEALPTEKQNESLTNLYNGLKEIDNHYDDYLKSQDALNKANALLNNQNILINTRLDDSTYKSYIDDCASISNLSLIFPVVFYLVAILVSLVSMNRMVNDDRMLIGTLKSLGFSNRHIVSKYLIFALTATILGGLVGAILGLYIIPTLINSIYKILFDVPKLYYGFNTVPTLVGFLLSAICIGGSTLFTLLHSLKEKPASLLRPKAPKAGKKILLEHLSLWHRLKFSAKVTIRNLFRYKKRVTITILAISGCTALMLCGFGIKDAISDLANKQYLEVLNMDATVIINNASLKLSDEALENELIIDKTYVRTISGNVTNYSVSLNVLDDNYQDFIKLKDVKSKHDMTFADNEVIITDKLASLLKVKKGDTITFLDDNLKEYQFKIGGICEYYITHVIFIKKADFINHYDGTYFASMAYLRLKEVADREAFLQSLLAYDEILNVSFVNDTIASANDMLKSLDKVVIILIVLSAMLSFVVLYNLSNINIMERKREIATLKVLGFYPREVDNYITRENIILTVLGILIGLLLGFFLTKVVVSTVEIEYVRFIQKIKPLSYLYSALLAILFTLIVNFIMHFSLKKIDMIESLKSVE